MTSKPSEWVANKIKSWEVGLEHPFRTDLFETIRKDSFVRKVQKQNFVNMTRKDYIEYSNVHRKGVFEFQEAENMSD